jgi:hypothetical protein
MKRGLAHRRGAQTHCKAEGARGGACGRVPRRSRVPRALGIDGGGSAADACSPRVDLGSNRGRFQLSPLNDRVRALRRLLHRNPGGGEVRSGSCVGGKARREQIESALPQQADELLRRSELTLVPRGGSCIAANLFDHLVGAGTLVRRGCVYSITSSARASNVGGTIRPSALAVFRLMRSSNVVGCSTGISAGFSPFKIRST